MAADGLAGRVHGQVGVDDGWELVGVSSTLLVAFFHERRGPVENGLRVWSVYRLSDAALLLAAVALHHLRGHGDFGPVLGAAPWHGRLYLGSGKMADQSLGPGAVLPGSVHGGPGRAGGGEELGMFRGMALYQQRTALQGDRAVLEKL